MGTYVEGVGACGKALDIGWEGWVQADWEALAPDLIHKIPGHDGGVVLVHDTRHSVLQHTDQSSRDRAELQIDKLRWHGM